MGDDCHVFPNGEPSRHDILAGRERIIAEAVDAMMDPLEGTTLSMVRQHVRGVAASGRLVRREVPVLLAGEIEESLSVRTPHGRVFHSFNFLEGMEL